MHPEGPGEPVAPALGLPGRRRRRCPERRLRREGRRRGGAGAAGAGGGVSAERHGGPGLLDGYGLRGTRAQKGVHDPPFA